MPSSSGDQALIGRAPDIRRLDALLDDMGIRGAATVVRGEAGIGKSALLGHARRTAAARGMRVLDTVGVESEAQLPFAVLQRLLRPILGRIDELSGPQHRALLAAFGLAEGAAPDPFLIALAVQGLVSDAATATPTLIVVDDAQWIDIPSAEALAFLARRLDSEPVVMLIALREGFSSAFADPGMDALRLERLDEAAAALLVDRHERDLTSAVRARVLQEAAGNPLALVELPFAVGHGAAAPLPVWLPLTTRLEEAFAARVAALPTATRTLVLMAALNDGPELDSTLAAAAAVLGGVVTLQDLTPAETARLVESDGRSVFFRHPLMRAAIRQRSSTAQRQMAHAALAHALAAEPERRVWHRAAACSGPDDDVAAELEVMALRAQARGAAVSAEVTWERAAGLSSQPGQRSMRLLRAAELAVELGRHDVVVRLLQEAAAIDQSAQQLRRTTWIRHSFDEGLGTAGEGIGALADVAVTVAGDGDPDFALRLLGSAALRCWWGAPTPADRHRVVAVSEQIDVDPGDPRLIVALAFAAPEAQGAVVHERLRRWTGGDAPSAHDARLLGNAATAIGAFDLAADFLAASLDDLRAQGRLGLLARALTLRSWSAVQLADLALAGPLADEAARLAHETSQPVVYATARASQAVAAALRGEDAEVFAREAEQVARPVGANAVLAAVQLARGAVALAGGQHAAAWDHVRRVHDPDDPAFHPTIRTFALADFSEAAVRSGHRPEAQAIVAQLEEATRWTTSPVLGIGLRHARAVLADDVEAEELYTQASTADLSRWPYQEARAQLAYGSWLRRHRRATESRVLLRRSHETFLALGIAPWADRAGQELRASGERSRRGTAAGPHQLTPQEWQIVALAADGLTNREIGEQLYLSHRTVSSHLHRIFPKLGVTSRSGLSSAIGRT